MFYKLIRYFSCLLIILISQMFFINTALSEDGEEKEITSGKCEELTLQDIPVGDWRPPITFPQTPYNLEQHYNTSKEEGFWYKGSYYYGHAGTDSDGASEKEGVNDIVSTQDCVIAASLRESSSGGWGEIMVCATRINQFSEEIITFHHGHMHADNENGYETTRQYNACEPVSRGYVLGKEGNTGFSSGSHLHFGMRLWKSFSSLKVAIEAGGGHTHGTSYSFGNDAKLKTNLNPESYLFNYFLDYNLPPGEPGVRVLLVQALRAQDEAVRLLHGRLEGEFWGADARASSRSGPLAENRGRKAQRYTADRHIRRRGAE